jgi:predicted regulator of Ras-like GTPase activity (Roadblock/LC7/MglB family)
MNRDPYAIALHNALTEIKKAYPDIKHSFIFTNNGSIVTGDPETDEKTLKNVLESFENLKEKAKAIGNLKSFSINGKNGKITLSSIDDMYLVLAASEKVDETQIHSITHVILPTILKTMKTFAPTHLQSPSTKKLVVDTLSGFFAGDSVQIDAETLMDWTNGEWTKNTDPRARVKAALTGEKTTQESIDHVRIETFSGNSTLCKVKEINDEKLKGKNMIRIPEKVCDTLEIKKGDLVKVKPML